MTELKPPGDWKVEPLGKFFRERREQASDSEYEPLSVSMAGVVPRMANVAISFNGENRKLVRKGDFVINSRSDRKGSAGVADRDGSVSLISIVLEPCGIEPRFVHHLLRSTWFQEEFYRWGSGIVDDLWSTRFQAMKRIGLPIPPVEQQRRIADYLDRETAAIDALIEKQRQLSDALRTRRRAAVLARTGFLGVKQPASAASSEPWLESAPSHWSRMHVRRLFDLTSGAGFPPELQGVTDEELAFYKVRDLGRTDSYGRLGEPEDTISRETADKLRAKVLPSGTLVMAKIGAALLLGRIRMATRPSCIDNNMLALSPKLLLYPRYATYMLEGLLLDRLVQPGAVPSLNEREFRRTVFPVPPLDEQREIADYLDAETAKIDALISKAERFIELAQERRAALITAAVTGQIEIPAED